MVDLYEPWEKCHVCLNSKDSVTESNQRQNVVITFTNNLSLSLSLSPPPLLSLSLSLSLANVHLTGFQVLHSNSSKQGTQPKKSCRKKCCFLSIIWQRDHCTHVFSFLSNVCSQILTCTVRKSSCIG